MTERYLNQDYFKDNERLRTLFCDAQIRDRPHTNEFWEIAYVYEGQGQVISNKQTKQIISGQFLVIAPGTTYSLRSPSKKDGAIVRVCKCIFTSEYFERIFNCYSSISDISNYELYKLFCGGKAFILHLSDDRRNNIEHLVWLIAHEYSHYTTGSGAVMEHAMISLFVCLSRLYENQVNKFEETAKNNTIDDLKDYMKTNFGYKITLEDLAEHFHLSREHISRYFKKYTGKTVSRFLLEVRIERAKSKLGTTLIPVSDIAEYCGYSSMSNFQKSFKKVTGQTPSEYRRTHKIITRQ